MEKPLADIREFVAGTMSPDEFRIKLYTNNAFEALLTNDPHLPKSGYIKGSVYQFLLEQDFDDPGGLLNIQGALQEFMNRNAISYMATREYSELFDIILTAQPKWLQVQTKFVQEKMLPASNGKKAKELKAWLREEFLRRFRFAKKPPKWIQSPNWPINENGPLVFIGQLDGDNYFHDTAAIYVFLDPVTKICETIIQTY